MSLKALIDSGLFTRSQIDAIQSLLRECCTALPQHWRLFYDTGLTEPPGDKPVVLRRYASNRQELHVCNQVNLVFRLPKHFALTRTPTEAELARSLAVFTADGWMRWTGFLMRYPECYQDLRYTFQYLLGYLDGIAHIAKSHTTH